MLSVLLLALQRPAAIDVGHGPVATTTVAVRVRLSPEGKVVSCAAAEAGPAACAGFPKGRVVAAPIRRNGKPVGGMMTVSTTTVVSAED